MTLKKVWVRLGCVVALATAMNYIYRPLSSGNDSSTKGALILYDAPVGDDMAKLGFTFAVMLRNLLGHFEMDADLRPIGEYKAGDIAPYSTVFYLGSHYDISIPDAFLHDVSKTKQRVVWFKYNLWELAWPEDLGFAQRFGMSFLDLHGLDDSPTPERPKPGFYDTVLYKDQALTKYYHYDPKTASVAADPDVGVIRIDDAAKAQVRVKIRNSATAQEIPYIVQSGNFWYVADIPLSYIGPRDRYLVFCDILHDILGINHPESHRALVRLEDVGAKVNSDSMKTLVDYLYGKQIPFSVAAFPLYKDPLGASNDGEPESIDLSKADTLRQSLSYAFEHGGSLVMHGYTHQYDSRKNPNTGVSADDYEFWDAVKNTPITEETESWATGRIDSGVDLFERFGFKPYAWEFPHYQGSPTSYQASLHHFPTTYQRVMYYSSPKPNLNATGAERDFEAGMFFPYPISKDSYGSRVIPENLGNIEYDISAIDPTSNITYTWRDILTNAEYGLVVRDGFGSFFFHPFWLDPDFQSFDAFGDFRNVIEGITELGYQWVAGTSVFPPDPSVSEPDPTYRHQRQRLGH